MSSPWRAGAPRRAVPSALAAAALCASALTACAGPAPRLSITSHEVPIDVAFGAALPGDPRAPQGPTTVAPVPNGLGVVPVPVPVPVPVTPAVGAAPPAPAPVAAPPQAPVAPAVVPASTNAVPAASRAPTPGPTRGVSQPTAVATTVDPDEGVPGPPAPVRPACPALDPLSASRLEADTEIVKPAPNGSYPYLLTGTTTVGDATTPVQTTAAATVSKSTYDAASRNSSFELTQSALGVTTVRDFSSTAAVQGQLGQLGLAKEASTSTPGYTATYTPLKALKLLQTPSQEQAAFKDSTSDPTTGTVVTIQATVVGVERVNACGRAIDAWRVDSDMNVVNAQENVTSTRTDWYATQYGGLPVQEKITYSGTTGPTMTKVSGSLLWDITVDPGAPR